MKKFKKTGFVFWFIWGLPQNVIGLIMFLKQSKKYKVEKHEGAYVTYREDSNKGAVSLGEFIFLFSNYHNKERIVKHEFGHTLQSRMLGPFYLIVIGAPSLIWNLAFQKYRRKHGISYYSFYTEKWANKLGGLE